MSTKEIPLAFFDLATKGKIREAYEKYIADDFIHHNQFFKGDRESLLKAMENDAADNPRKEFELKLVLEEGEFAATHSFVRQSPGENGYVLAHFFRIKNGKIVEMWDLGQEIYPESPNENGVF